MIFAALFIKKQFKALLKASNTRFDGIKNYVEYEAFELGKPDLIIIEGQGALSHPAYLSSCFIIRGSRPDAIILQHAPGRKMLGDYPKIPMPTVESEIQLVETFSGSKVIRSPFPM